MSNIPFLVAIPKREINPIIAGMLIIPSVILTAITPPINANGRFSKITAACVKFLNCAKSKRYITRIENIDITRSV